MSIREVVYASAGFGKTFRISSRIIGLLAEGAAPDSILASTFTRKASGEILDRVLQRLAHASVDEERAAGLAREILGSSDARNAEWGAAQWAEVLALLVRDIQRFDVSTLDSFFARVVRAFGNELGLTPGWTVADAPTGDRMRREALEALFESHDHRIILELVRALNPGEIRRSIHERLLEDVTDIVLASRDIAPDAVGWTALNATLEPLPADLAKACGLLADEVLDVELPTKGDGTPNKRWTDAAQAMATQLRDQDWDGLIAGGLGKKVLEGDPHYYNVAIPDDLVDLIEQALRLVRTVQGHRLAQRAEALGKLAREFDAVYSQRMHDAGALQFEDVTRLMTGGVGDNGFGDPASRPDFFARMDSGLEHILLDEFQDTSLPQWRALVPLLDRLMFDQGQGATVVVADPKQSIYGWRGAASAVVEAARTRYQLGREDLDVSWRSSPPVLEAVNQVFKDLGSLAILQDKPGDAEIAEAWGDAFVTHRSSSKTRELPGRVRLIGGPELIGTGGDQPRFMRSVARHVADLHAAAPDLSIGVLVRTNKTVGRIIVDLQELGVEASQEGGTPLGDSPALAAVFALLRLADHPGDRLAAYHVANSPLGELMGLRAATPHAVARVSSEVRAGLVQQGYGPWFSELEQRLLPHTDRREAERLARLSTLAYQWDRSSQAGSLRITEFLDRALAERVASVSDAPVRVMTVHQAKGLEFDLVVLAELHHSSGRSQGTGKPIVYREEPTAPATQVFPYMSESLAKLFGDIEPLGAGKRDASAAATRDWLSALYVAMTRARYGLDMIVPADPDTGSKRSRPSTARNHANLIREALGVSVEAGGVNEGKVAWELPQGGAPDDWWTALPDRPHRAARHDTPDVPRLELRTGRTRQLDRTSPSGKEGGGRVDIRFTLGLTDLDGGARAKGTLVHAWMEYIDWIDQTPLSEDVALRIARKVTPDLPEATVRQYLSWTLDKLKAPSVIAALSRESAPGDSEVRAEVPILVPDGPDALMRGFIDRLVVTRERGMVRRAEVLDFKTDAMEAGDDEALQERVEYYSPQMRAYREAVHLQYHVPRESVSTRLMFLEIGELVEVLGTGPDGDDRSGVVPGVRTWNDKSHLHGGTG